VKAISSDERRGSAQKAKKQIPMPPGRCAEPGQKILSME
jgi:hypothetical protein